MAVEREEWDNVKETTLQTPRSMKKEGEEVLKMPEQRVFPCNSWWRPWWGKLSPCSPWRSTVEQMSTCSLWKGPHARTGGCPKEAVTPWGARAGAGSWQDLRTRGERSPCRSRFAGRTCDPMGGPRWSSLFLKDCTLWEGSILEQLVKNCSAWEGLTLENFLQNRLSQVGPHTGAGEECEESSPWEGRSSRDNVGWNDRNPHSPSPCTTGRQEAEKSGVKLRLGRREGWGKVF